MDKSGDLYPKSWYKSFPLLRYEQTANYGFVPNSLQPHTFMATAIDLVDTKDPIHSRYKAEVAERLVLGALSIAYGEKSYWSGPLISHVTLNFIRYREWNLRVLFKNDTIGKGGLELRSNKGIEVSIFL